MKNHTQSTSISRRDLLKGLSVSALGMAFLQSNSTRIIAQDEMMGLPLPAKYYGFTVGDFQMMVISDASVSLPAPIMGANVDEADVTAFMDNKKLLSAEGTIPNIIDILVLNTGDDLILFDTGLGSSNQLHSTLGAVGIHPEDVTKVIISHQHGDHVGGLSSEENGLTYPNAEVFFSQAEFDSMEADNSALVKLQPAIDADMVTFYNDGDSIVGGVTAMAAHGHTPGHMAFMIESNGEVLMNAVDSAINVYSGTQHPDWHVRFDSIPDMAVENRKRVFAMSSDDNIRLFGYHFPFPGIGYAVRQGDADEWLWTPTSY